MASGSATESALDDVIRHALRLDGSIGFVRRGVEAFAAARAGGPTG